VQLFCFSSRGFSVVVAAFRAQPKLGAAQTQEFAPLI
jgi:hypothetical protein